MTVVGLLRASIIAPSSRAEQVLDELYRFGDFHVEGGEEGERHARIAALYNRARSLSLEVEAMVRQLNISAEQGVIDIILKGEKLERLIISVESVEGLVKKLEEEVSSVIPELKNSLEELRSIEEEISQKESLESTLRTISSANIDIFKLAELRRLYAAIYVANSRDVPEIKRSLDRAYVHDLPIVRNLSMLLIVARRVEEDKVERIVRSFNLMRVEIPTWLKGDPREAYEQLRKVIEDLRKKREEIKARIEEAKTAKATRILALRDAAETLRESLDRLRGERLRRTLVLKGYIPANRRDEFLAALSDKAYVSLSEIRQSHQGHVEHRDEPPTLVRYNKYFEAYKPITELQGTPGYFEIDPTPYVAVFFAIFYGIMFADLGQGLIILAMGLILMLRARSLLKTWGRLLAFLGASSSITGFLIMEAFGFKIYVPGMEPIIEIVEKDEGAATLSPHAILALFQFTLLLGFVHVSIGMFLGFLKYYRLGEKVEAITSKLTTLIMYIFGLLFALAFFGAGGFDGLTTSTNPAPLLGIPAGVLGTVALYGIMACILVLMFGRLVAGLLGRAPRVSPISAIGAGLLEVLENIIHFMSNTLSYVRLTILLLIHVALMLLVNASWEGIGIASLPILIIGNIGVMALEGTLVFIQALRLHLYEFFTKFYEGSGRPFTPLKISSKLVEVFIGSPAGRKLISATGA